MARNFDGSTQYLRYGGNAGLTAYPFSIACWIRTSDTSLTFRDPFGIENGDDSNFVLLQLGSGSFGTTAGAPLFAVGVAAGNNAAISSTTVNDGAWHHLCGVSSGSASRILYIDGSQAASNTTDETSFPPL